MKKIVVFVCLFLDGAFADEVKSVSVMEGEDVNLYTDVSDVQTADRILWVSESTRIAQNNMAARKISIYDDALDGRFRHRLSLDRHTGSLTITNVRTTDSGLYELQIVKGSDVISRRFSIIVSGFSAHLPVPDITSDCTPNSSSSSKCVVLCSVLNVSHVSLSWYKGSSLLSSISVSDLHIRLSLPLEVDYEDTNTHTCVLNNTITNHTQHLNITQLCQCSELSGVNVKDVLTSHLTILMGAIVVAALVVGASVMIFCIYKRLKQKVTSIGQTNEEEQVKLNGVSAVAESHTRKTLKDGVKYIKVKAGDPIKLDTGVTDIRKCDLMQWKFGELGDKTSPFVAIGRINKDYEESLKNDVIKKWGDRLKVIGETGSIAIDNSKTTDTGFYKLEIDSSTDHIIKSFFVTVRVNSVCDCNSAVTV